MTPEEWRKIKEVLQTALELEPQARQTFLDNECVGQVPVRREVESLLRSDEQDRAFLEEPAVIDAADVLASTASPDRVGSRLGPYELLERIGEGGMGDVYCAVRADGMYDKQVAIKLIHSGLSTDFFLSRFKNERQILAALEHPNIARLLDGGLAENGMPYVVLEFVAGVAIDEYCARHDLSITDRLKLFRTVCSAVQYAHRNLVVHRDLKPGNILVTEDGIPKLLDFGIAKILNPQQEQTEVDRTLTVMRIMTPDFASPEQVRGGPITTSSDVYSLGVILYVLLTGRRPYHVSSTAPHEIIKAICDMDPEKPSTAVSRAEKPEKAIKSDSTAGVRAGTEPKAKREKLSRELAGDLDNIVLKALWKEPERRYQTVEQFSEDVRRHLESLPILALKSTVTYRCRKYVVRHRLGVAAAGSSLAMLIAFAVVQAVQLRRITRERDRANRIADFMTSMFKVSDPSESRGNIVTAREILDKAAKDMETGLARDPELQAQMMSVIGNVYDNLGLYSSAVPLFTSAGEIRRHVFGPENRETLSSMGDLAWVLYEQGHYLDAERLERATLQIRIRALGAEHPDTLKAMNGLGEILRAEAKYPEAEKLFRESLAIKRRVLGPDNAATVVTMGNLASTLDEEGRLAEAEKLQRETLDLKRRILGPQHPITYGSMNAVALDLQKERRLAEAEKWFRDTLQGEHEVLGPEHPQTLWTITALGKTLLLEGRYEAAQKLCRQTLNVQRRVLGPNHPDTASSKVCLASIDANTQKRDKALLLLRDAIDHGLGVKEALSLESAPEFNALHDDPRFDALIAYARQRAASVQNTE